MLHNECKYCQTSRLDNFKTCGNQSHASKSGICSVLNCFKNSVLPDYEPWACKHHYDIWQNNNWSTFVNRTGGV